MLPLARIGENVRAALGVGFEIAVGTDGDMVNLRFNPINNAINQRLTLPGPEAFIYAV